MPKLIVLALAATLCGCMTRSPVGFGVLFTDVSSPVTVGSGEQASIVGYACAINILGLIAVGDASIEAARRSMQITKISSVDEESQSFLMLFSRSCTVVRGN